MSATVPLTHATYVTVTPAARTAAIVAQVMTTLSFVAPGLIADTAYVMSPLAVSVTTNPPSFAFVIEAVSPSSESVTVTCVSVSPRTLASVGTVKSVVRFPVFVFVVVFPAISSPVTRTFAVPSVSVPLIVRVYVYVDHTRVPNVIA